MTRSHHQRSLTFIGLCLAGLSLSAVNAQDPRTGSRLGNRLESGKPQTTSDAIINAHTLARCIYQVRGRTVDRYLMTTVPEDQENAADLVFKDVECEFYRVDSALTDTFGVYSSPASMRGLLAEAALRKLCFLNDLDKQLPRLPIAEGYNKTWFKMTQRSNTVNAMSACFADTRPDLVVNLLKTKPVTKEENKAIGEVAGELGPCLINGAQLQANAFTLRAALAEGYFHRAMGANEDVAPRLEQIPSEPSEATK